MKIINDISTESVKILWFFCLHPVFNSKWAVLYTLLNVSLSSLFTVLAIKTVLVSYNDIFVAIEGVQTIITTFHTTGNLLTLYTQRPTLLKLLEQKSRFWEISKHDKELHKESSKNSHFVKNIIRTYFIFSFFSGILFVLQPVITGNLPEVCYVPEGWFTYLTVIQWYMTYVVIISVIGTACFFCSLVYSLSEQFQLLAYRFRGMCNNNFDNIWKEFKALVDHHNFLISYCEELNVAFRSIFLLAFLLSIASASLSVFISMQPGAWVNRMKFLTHFLAIIFEIGFYCVPLELVTSTVLKIDNILYDSKWYQIDMISFKKCLTLVICRAQKPIVFSGYGLVNINLNTYVLICKTVFSFYTYINSFKKLSTK